MYALLKVGLFSEACLAENRLHLVSMDVDFKKVEILKSGITE